jgi:hypothetical protein
MFFWCLQQIIRVQVFMPLDRFACAHSTRKTGAAISEP